MAQHRRGEREARRRGFTLVEVLVTLAVAGVLLAFLYQFFTAQQRSQTLQEDLADAQQSGRVALEELTRTVSSLGSGTSLEDGQVRLLLAQPYQLVFNADLDPGIDALAPGAAVPGAQAGDPYPAVPAGTNAAAWTAETYRYTLDANGDGRVTAADRRPGRHFVLYREKNGGQNEEVAALVANPDLGEPLFRYWGDFDGDGTQEALDHVTAATSPRIAAGEPLDAVIRRVEFRVVARTAGRSAAGGYRDVRLTAAVSPENLWDCPILTAPASPGPFSLPDLRGQTTTLRFRVTRGGVPEAGRTVAFEGRDPAGGPLPVTDVANTGSRTLTDADGVTEAVVRWPAGCNELRLGTYTVRAWTEEPPTLATPFGTCSSHEVTVAIVVEPGAPDRVWFSDPVAVESCGDAAGTQTVGYEFRDACDHRVLAVSDDQARLRLAPDPAFFQRLSPQVLNQVTGTVTYESPRGSYAGYQVPRAPAAPNPYTCAIEAYDPRTGAVVGSTPLAVRQVPSGDLVGLTARATATAFRDCPDPAVPVRETFGVNDRCGNPLPTLVATGSSVWTRLVRQVLPGQPFPVQGAIASPGNRAAFGTADLSVVQHDGTAGQFAVEYLAPTCTLGGLTYAPKLTLTPNWAGSIPREIPLRVGPCQGCSVQVFDLAGNAITHLNKVCDGRSRLVVTQCVPAGTTAEVVIGRVAGAGMLSFDRNAALERTTQVFAAAGAAQTVALDLFIGTARSGDTFRVAAFIPNQAAVQAGNGVICQSEVLSVDSRCSEILVSAVPDNPGAVPPNRAADDTPLCADEGRLAYFRVKDCDQNVRSAAWDDLRNTAGTGRGLLVELVDETGAVLDREGPDLLEVDVHGTRSTDSPYFQGSLPFTHDAADGDYSGRVRAPLDRVTTLRARYVDPDDPADGLCVAEALVVPPLPACLYRPLVTGAGWTGPLRVHWGDAVVAGGLTLPDPPALVAKDAVAPLSGAPYGAGGRDPFFDAYVGGRISVAGSPLAPAGAPDQPFLPGGAGEAWSTQAGHYFQAVPDVASLASPLDYRLLKAIAQARKVYWVPEAGGSLFNPRTLARGTFEEVTRLPGPGLPSPTHDGRFLFVDAPPGFQSGALIDQAPAGALPTYHVNGGYYTEGLVYVAGSVAFHDAGGKQSVAAVAPGVLDARYDENQGGFTRADLPVDYAPPLALVAAGPVEVNLNGALYCDGEVELPDGFGVFGAVVAERGGRALGDADLWYDARWRDARPSLCSRCCALALTPTAARLALGAALPLAALDARGAVVWESLGPQVATVDQAGRVQSVAVGRATIRAVDAGGCVAETEVEVF